MSKMIQVRNVPDRLHRELMKRAKRAGLSLTDYIQRVLEREVSRPPALYALWRMPLDRPTYQMVRTIRDSSISRSRVMRGRSKLSAAAQMRLSKGSLLGRTSSAKKTCSAVMSTG